MGIPFRGFPDYNGDIPFLYLTLSGCNDLKRGELLFDPHAFTLGVPDFFIFMLGNGQDEIELLFTLLTCEIIGGHGRPP